MPATARSYVQAGREAAYVQGSALPAAVAAKKLIPVTESKFDLKKTYDQPNEQRNSYAKFFQNLQPLTREVEWSMKGLWYPDTCLGLMTMVTGNNPTITSTAAASPNPLFYTWSFLAQDSLQSMTLEEFDGTETWQHPNCFCTKAEFDFNAEKDFTYSLSGFGLDKVQHAMTPSLTQPTELPHSGVTARCYLDDVGGTPGTTIYADVLSGKISIDLATKPIRTAQNTALFVRMYRGKRAVTVDLDVDFQGGTDTVEYQQKYMNNVYRYLQVTFNGALLPGGSGGENTIYLLTFIVPCRYESFVIDKSKEHATGKIKGIGVLDPTQGYDYQVNAVVSSTSSALANY